MRIKVGDKWKTAFSMLESAFELIVIFFELTNLPVTFQVMMNNLLRNIIEAKDVARFINDVMIGMETEKKHDKIVKEVLRRMAENDLFVKLEKYVWKVREVGFLGVIIELDKVKMEEKKI